MRDQLAEQDERTQYFIEENNKYSIINNQIMQESELLKSKLQSVPQDNITAEQYNRSMNEIEDL